MARSRGEAKAQPPGAHRWSRLGLARPRLLKGLALSVAGATVVAGVAPQPAVAFKLFGYTFFESDKPVSPDAQPYKITVNVIGGDSDLKGVIQNASLLYSSKDETPPPSTPAFLSRARAEYERILAALYAAGRYGGSITILVNGQPIEKLKNDVTLPRPVPVVIDVNPGPLFTFGAIVMKGRAPHAPADDNPKTATPENLGLIAGRPANSGIVLQSEQALVDAWRRLGYAKARPLERSVVADHRNNRLNVTIGVDPGRPAHYGTIAVTGTTDMNPAFVARQTALVPGERYDPAEVELAKRRLQHLQVFSATSIVEGDAIAPDGSLPMMVKVAESPLHVFGAGASYSTADGAGVNGYWEHRNLFGEAERLRFDVGISGVNSSNPRDFIYLGGITFVKPGIFDPFTDLTAQIFASREVYDPYSQNSFGARVGLAHEFSQQLTGKIAVNGEYDEVADGFGRRDLLFFSLPSELAYDTTDDKLEPTRGYRIKGTFEPFYEAKFGNFGGIAFLDGSAYFSFDRSGRYVLAGRAAVGSIFGAPADEMPANRLFFAGGGGSVRGYDYRSLGPRLADGVIVGGRSLVEGSLEMRMKVTDTIGVVPFVDAGNAFATTYPDFKNPLAVGAGIGLRYYTGLGAIRVDIARALTHEPGQPPFALYIGLGESF